MKSLLSLMASLVFTSLVLGDCKVDICFVIDESSALTPLEYNKELELTRNLVKKVGGMSTTASSPRFSAWKYGHRHGKKCGSKAMLSAPTEDQVMFQNRLSGLVYRRGSSSMNLYGGIQCCYWGLERSNLARVIVVLVGGNKVAGDPAMVEAVKSLSHDTLVENMVNVISIGVHSGLLYPKMNAEALRHIGTDPSYNHIVHLNDTQSVALLSKVGNQICHPTFGSPKQPPSTPIPAPQPSLSPKEDRPSESPPPTGRWPQTACEVDFCFAVGQSTSLGQSRFNKQLDFVSKVVEAVDRRATDPVIGMTPYSPTFAGYLFDDHWNDGNIVSARTYDVHGFLRLVKEAKGRYRGGMTDMSSGLERCYTSLSPYQHKTRVLVLLADSKANRGPGYPSVEGIRSHLHTLSNTISSSFINLFTIGIHPENDSSFLDHELLRKMATIPSYYSTVTFDTLTNSTELGAAVESMAEGLCRPLKMVSRTRALGNTVTPLKPVVGKNIVCPCSALPPGAALSGVGCPVEGAAGVCKLGPCLESEPRYICNYHGALNCRATGVGAMDWMCTHAGNSSHCPCRREAAVRLSVQHDDETMTTRPTFRPMAATRY